MSSPKNPDRVHAGLLAAMHNPNTSEEAKDRVQQRLDDMREAKDDEELLEEEDELEEEVEEVEEVEEDGEVRQSRLRERVAVDVAEDQEHINRQLGGYKATIHNPNTTPKAKRKARNVLKEHGVNVEQ